MDGPVLNAPEFPDRRSDGRPLLFRIFFFAAFGFLLYQLLKIVAPFFNAILVAIVLAMVFYPLHVRFLRWFRHRTNLAAAVSVSSLFLMVVVPMVFFLLLFGKQAAALYPWAQEQVQAVRADPHNAIEDRLPAPLKKLWVRGQDLMDKAGTNTKDLVLNAVEKFGSNVSGFGASLLKNTLVFVIQTAIMVFTLFFLFRDGARVSRAIVELIPMEEVHKAHILTRLNETLTAVVRGMFIVASVQGLLAGVGYAVAGVRFSVVLGFATAFFALIPIIGATTVWLPVSLMLIAKGWVVPGVGLMIWGALVVSMVDNFLRPFIIGEQAKLPIALLFFGTLGGLQAYGPIGLIVGPLIVATVLAFAKIYGEQVVAAKKRAHGAA